MRTDRRGQKREDNGLKDGGEDAGSWDVGKKQGLNGGSIILAVMSAACVWSVCIDERKTKDTLQK